MTSTMPPTRNLFQRPVSLMIRPVTMLETSRPPTIAIDIRPACGRATCRGRAGSTG